LVGELLFGPPCIRTVTPKRVNVGALYYEKQGQR